MIVSVDVMISGFVLNHDKISWCLNCKNERKIIKREALFLFNSAHFDIAFFLGRRKLGKRQWVRPAIL